MFQAGQDAAFGVEARQHLGAAHRQHLDGDLALPIGGQLLGQVNAGHAAFADQAHDAVVAQPGAGVEHRSGIAHAGGKQAFEHGFTLFKQSVAARTGRKQRLDPPPQRRVVATLAVEQATTLIVAKLQAGVEKCVYAFPVGLSAGHGLVLQRQHQVGACPRPVALDRAL